MIKTYVLDTNVLLSDPYAMVRGFDDNEVVITSTVLQEIDSKKRVSELSYYAQKCGKILDELREEGNLIKGVKNESGGITRIEPDGVDKDLLPVGYSLDAPDNRIISSCIYIKKNSKKNRPVILVSDDILMRVNATAAFAYAEEDIGIQSYRNIRVNEKDAEYMGWCDLKVKKETIDTIYGKNSIDYDDVKVVGNIPDFITPTENEFFTFKNGSQSAMTVFQKGRFNLINPKQALCGWVKPKNELQGYAMWLLKSKNIPLKILIGAAGTGKTFLALAEGLDDTIGQKKGGAYYEKMLISRPVYGYEEIGFLPGDIEDKLNSSLNLNYIDNLETLLRRGGKEDREQIKMQTEDLFATGTIEVCALSFVRGRSIMNSYLICDEAQNANSTLIRDVITRAGEATSVVLAGDPKQIDVNLDSHNNGLVYAASKMKGSPMCGIIKFPPQSSVRSSLAKEATERM